jgi:hypothetical protein
MKAGARLFPGGDLRQIAADRQNSRTAERYCPGGSSILVDG